MKTLSNAELQDAIGHTARLIKGDNSHQDTILIVHLENLTDEQRYRATDELTLEPMATTLERAEFDARVEAQDGPEWVEWSSGECPVEPGEDTEVEFRDGQTRRDEYPEGWRWHHKNNSLDIMRYRTWEQSK